MTGRKTGARRASPSPFAGPRIWPLEGAIGGVPLRSRCNSAFWVQFGVLGDVLVENRLGTRREAKSAPRNRFDASSTPPRPRRAYSRLPFRRGPFLALRCRPPLAGHSQPELTPPAAGKTWTRRLGASLPTARVKHEVQRRGLDGRVGQHRDCGIAAGGRRHSAEPGRLTGAGPGPDATGPGTGVRKDLMGRECGWEHPHPEAGRTARYQHPPAVAVEDANVHQFGGQAAGRLQSRHAARLGRQVDHLDSERHGRAAVVVGMGKAQHQTQLASGTGRLLGPARTRNVSPLYWSPAPMPPGRQLPGRGRYPPEPERRAARRHRCRPCGYCPCG